jgi:hypothetical protein
MAGGQTKNPPPFWRWVVNFRSLKNQPLFAKAQATTLRGHAACFGVGFLLAMTEFIGTAAL